MSHDRIGQEWKEIFQTEEFAILLTLLLILYKCDALYEPWSPPWNPREDLNCIESCFGKEYGEYTSIVEKDEIDKCCTCNSIPTWYGSTVSLYIELVSIFGKSMVIPYEPFNNDSVYSIDYSNQQLKQFPSNLCNWDYKTDGTEEWSDLVNLTQFWGHIVKIIFSHNDIEETVNLNCLSRLDTVDLSFNKLTHLSNTSFQNLTYLRELILTNNNLRTMDSTVISSPLLSLQRVDISNNFLTEMDITNFFSLKPFCSIKYNSNPITEFTNPLGFKIDTSKTYGPGFVSIKDSMITEFPDFKELLHLDSLAVLGTLMAFGFDLGGIPLICDCNLEPFMSLAKDLIESLWQDYFNITCDGPENLKGKSVKHFINPDNHRELICDLSHTRECSQYNCSCINQPSSNTLFMNCSGKNLTEMPDPLPPTKFSTSVNLDLSNNNIKELINTSYLQNVSHLSLAGNDLMIIHETAASMLENASVIDLSNNENLRVIPQVMKYMTNDSVKLNGMTIRCDCDATWIQDSKVLDGSNFTCRVPNHGDIPSDDFSSDLLDCDEYSNLLIMLSIVLGFLVALLIILGSVSYKLRYEILILLIRCKQAAKNKIVPTTIYDAFLSFDDDDDNLRIWINKILVPYLEDIGYKLFNPLRDLDFGNPRELNTLEALLRSKNLLIVLSQSYTLTEQKSWLQHEWKYGWNMFKKDRNRNIVMINFDQILTSDITQSQIKAFLRVGGPIDFSNTERNIMEKICQKLGWPSSKRNDKAKEVVNKKTFTAWQLFKTGETTMNPDNIIEWIKLDNRPETPATVDDITITREHSDIFSIPKLRNASETTSIKSNNEGVVIETNTGQLHVEDEMVIEREHSDIFSIPKLRNRSETASIQSNNEVGVHEPHIEPPNLVSDKGIHATDGHTVIDGKYNGIYSSFQKLRTPSETASLQSNNSGVQETNIEQLDIVSEKERPAFGRYKYYV